jgi:hypothetical protein
VGLGGARSRVTGSVRRRGVGRRGVRSCGIGQAAWCQAGGAGSIGRAGRTHTHGVGRLGTRGSVGLLGPGDGPSITLGDE